MQLTADPGKITWVATGITGTTRTFYLCSTKTFFR